MAVRAITFDFWFTLFRDAQSAERSQIRVDAFANMTGTPKDAVAEALNDAAQAFLRHHVEKQRTLGPLDAVRMAANAAGVSLSEGQEAELTDIFANAILEYPAVPIEGALEAVRAAAALLPIGVVSDSGMSPGSSLAKLLDQHDFTRHFGALTFSDEVGVSKPQAPMFETTARALGVRADELLHIGDIEITDVQGAHAVGAKAVLFAGVNDRYLKATEAEYTFTTWRDFIDALPSLL